MKSTNRLSLLLLVLITLHYGWARFAPELTTCSVGAVQQVEWFDDGDGTDGTDTADATATATPGETGGLKKCPPAPVAAFEALRARDWPCPVLVTGQGLRSTVPVLRWGDLDYLQGKCSSDTATVDVSAEPIFTYYDKQAAFASRVAATVISVANAVHAQKLPDHDPAETVAVSASPSSDLAAAAAAVGKALPGLSTHASAPGFPAAKFLADLRNDPRLFVAGSNPPQPDVLAAVTAAHRYLRFGGKVGYSPCPHLSTDAGDYDRDAWLKSLPSHRGGGGSSRSGGDGQPKAPSSKGSGPSLWLGSRGVVSSAHFDFFDNLFCVVAGTKRLLLLPPSAANLLSLAPFPGAHPHARQAQVLVLG